MLDQASNFEMKYQPRFLLHSSNEYDRQLQHDRKIDQKVSLYFGVFFQLLFGEQKVETDESYLNLTAFVVVVR